MHELFSLAGKVAVVTGANTGLGRAMATALAGAGARLVLVGRSEPTETLEAIGKAENEAGFVHADLSQPGCAQELVAQIAERWGALDILVNNAGIIRRSPALQFAEEDWDVVLATNLKTPFFLAQAAARHMLEAGRGGKIINIASLLSFQGGILVASYTASKSGLAGLTRLLANEWASRGINVNAIVPGYFATNNTQALRDDPERSRDILARIPAGRWGDPADLGGAVVFLAAPASDYVHGALLPVDGGWLAR